jgi:hypothetical protein
MRLHSKLHIDELKLQKPREPVRRLRLSALLLRQTLDSSMNHSMQQNLYLSQ